MTLHKLKQSLSIDLLGYGFLRAWIVMCLLYSRQSTLDNFASSLLLMGSLAISAFTVAPIQRTRSYQQHKSSFDLLFLACGILGSCLAFFGNLLGSLVYVAIGFITLGLCGGYFETLWSERFVGYPEKQSYGNLLLAFLMAAVLGIATSIPTIDDWFLGESLALLGISAVIYQLPQHNNSNHPTSTNSLVNTIISAESSTERNQQYVYRIMANVVLTTLFFCFVQALASSLSYSLLPVASVYQARFAANFIVAALLVVIFFLRASVSPLSLLKTLLPITATGLFLLVLDPATVGTVPIIILFSGNKLFDVLMLFLLISFLKGANRAPALGFGLFVGAKNLGSALGTITGGALLPFISESTTALFLFIGLAEVILIISFLWMFSIKQLNVLTPEPSEITNPSTIAQESSLEKRLDSHVHCISERFGLTPSETKILGYLARGKNRESIAHILNLSKSTVHTHTVHIYQKTDTHSQQDLIALVESEIPDQKISTNLV